MAVAIEKRLSLRERALEAHISQTRVKLRKLLETRLQHTDEPEWEGAGGNVAAVVDGLVFWYDNDGGVERLLLERECDHCGLPSGPHIDVQSLAHLGAVLAKVFLCPKCDQVQREGGEQ